MRILLVDHACSDHPRTRVHRLREGLESHGIRAAVCGPSTVPALAAQPPDMHGIHLHDVAAASRRLLAAVREGSAESLLAAVSTVPARLLGLVRETARQMLAEATDVFDPDVIFVLHAGILTDLAVETGAPTVVHVAVCDLAAADSRPSLRRLIAAAIGSSEVVAAGDPDVAARLRNDWLGGDADGRCETWPLDPATSAPVVAAACGRALARRRGG